MLQNILKTSYIVLLFFTPLFFTPYNNELFEYNKMLLVYALTVIITTCWVLKMVFERKVIFKKTPLDIPILIFLISQLLSTIFSIDPHTSIWGYYSRSNGGLLSIFSYVILFYGLVSNFTKEDLSSFLKGIMTGGLLVSLWAIPEHFGFSPSCAILVGQFSADCWVQDVQARVFATLGQPNWLAAYLSMIIFIAMYFALTARTKFQTAYYLLLTTIYYLAFTFTYSRGASLGLIFGLMVFLAFQPGVVKLKLAKLKPLSFILGAFLVVNLLFGSALTGDFRLIKQSAPPPRPALTSAAASSNTQLETGGTESGQIRLIVWKGALDIFRHYYILGSGVETFAYAYYQFRPSEHNNVSEWDFLYNKAHNEYLNYLATTGILGFGAYMFMIGTFWLWVMRNRHSLLITSLFAGYVSYLIQNIFGFSVVMIALLFYLFPGLTFLAAGSLRDLEVKNLLLKRLQFIPKIIYKRILYRRLIIVLILTIGVYYLMTISRIWLSDRNYKLGSDFVDSGNVGRGYNYILQAVYLNGGEPLFRSDLGYAAASAAVALLEQDATEAGRLKEEGEQLTDEVLKKHPKNVSFFRTAIRTYFELSLLDPSYEQKTIEVVDKTIALAPTDPKLYYNKALILSQLGRPKEAVEVAKKAIELRPKYREAHLSLGSFYNTLGEKDKAKEEAEFVLKMIPNDAEALKLLEEAR